MDRRRIFLVVAVIVALMGTALVFLYVRGADQRAESRFETVEVLRVTQAIEAGESIDDAAAAGKIAMQPVVRDYLQSGYQTSLERPRPGSTPPSTIYPGEQVVEGKFDAEAVAVDVRPPDQGERVGRLGQPHRPRPGRRLRQPGLRGRDLLQRASPAAAPSPGCCSTG